MNCSGSVLDILDSLSLDVTVDDQATKSNDVVAITSEPAQITDHIDDAERRMTMKDFKLDFNEKVVLILLKMKTSLGMTELNADIAQDIFGVTFGTEGPDIDSLTKNKSNRFKGRRINHYYELEDGVFILFPKCSSETIKHAQKLYQELDDFINLDIATSYKQKLQDSRVFYENWHTKFSVLGQVPETSLKRCESDNRCDVIPRKQPKVDQEQCVFDIPVIIETDSDNESSEHEALAPINGECFDDTVSEQDVQSSTNTNKSPSRIMLPKSMLIQSHKQDHSAPQNETNESSLKPVNLSTIIKQKNGDKQKEGVVNGKSQTEKLCIDNSPLNGFLPHPTQTTSQSDGQHLMTNVSPEQSRHLQTLQSNSHFPTTKSNLTVNLSESQDSSLSVCSQPPLRDSTEAHSKCQQKSMQLSIAERRKQPKPEQPSIQEATILIFDVGFFWKGFLFQSFNQWHQCMAHTCPVTFACSWCKATFSYNRAQCRQRVYNESRCSSFVQLHAQCFSMLRYTTTVSRDLVMFKMSSLGKEETHCLSKKVPATAWIVQVVHERFVNSNYKAFNNVEKVPDNRVGYICRKPVSIKCGICNNWTKDARHLELEFPLSLPLFTIQRLVDYESIKHLPSNVIVELIQTEQPLYANNIRIPRADLISNEIVLDMFDANEACWSWLSEKFGLNETHKNNIIYVNREELVTMLNGRKINQVSRIHNCMRRRETDRFTELSIDEIPTLMLTRRLKRKIPFVNLVQNTGTPGCSSHNQQNPNEVGRKSSRQQPLRARHFESPVIIDIDAGKETNEDVAKSRQTPSFAPQTRQVRPLPPKRFAETLKDVLDGLPVRPESEPEDNEEDDDCCK